MWYLYLDESGDLGFDFVNKKPSKFFTVTILALTGKDNDKQLIKEANVTLRRKLNPPNKRKRLITELKGNGTTIEVKKYLYQRIKDVDFSIYSINLEKRGSLNEMIENKARVYNYISHLLLQKIPFDNANTNVNLIIDKSKSKKEIAEFNEFIRTQIEARINPRVSLYINHAISHQFKGLQIADVFSWGIFRKYEKNDTEWYDYFSEKIACEEIYK